MKYSLTYINDDWREYMVEMEFLLPGIPNTEKIAQEIEERLEPIAEKPKAKVESIAYDISDLEYPVLSILMNVGRIEVNEFYFEYGEKIK